LKSSAKNGGSNWVPIQGTIFLVLIVISGLLSLPYFWTFITSIMLFGE